MRTKGEIDKKAFFEKRVLEFVQLVLAALAIFISVGDFLAFAGLEWQKNFEPKIPSAILFILGLVTIFQLLERRRFSSKLNSIERKLTNSVESKLTRLLHEMEVEHFVETDEIYELAERLISRVETKIRVAFFPGILENLPPPQYLQAIESRLKKSIEERSPFRYQLILGYDQKNLEQLKNKYDERQKEYASQGLDRLVSLRWINSRVGITLFLVDDSYLLLVFPCLRTQGFEVVLKFEENSNSGIVKRISDWYEDLWNEATSEPLAVSPS